MRIAKSSYIITVFALLVSACANITVPTGGPKDMKGPEVKEAQPPNETLNFTGDKIVLQFDEYIKLNNAIENVVVSPPIDPAPQYILKGKKLIVKLPDVLRENTTYSFNFSAAVTDNNEGNPIANYQYVISTGNYLDSLKIGGVVVNAADGKAVENAYVCLYNDLSDSIAFYEKPYYFAKTNASGNFQINYLAPGTYKLLSFQDQNNDLLYNQNSEPVAFFNEPIIIAADSTTIHKTDSTETAEDSLSQEHHQHVPQYKLNLFTPRPEGIKLISSDTKYPGKIYLIYSNPIDSIQVKSATDTAALEGISYEINESKDTISIWYSRNYAERQPIEITVNDSIIDTLALRSYPINKDSIPFERFEPDDPSTKRSSTIDQVVELGTQPDILWSRPVDTILTERIKLVKDTTETIDFKLVKTNKPKRLFNIEANWEHGANYQLTIRDSSFYDVYGLTHDSIIINYKVKTTADYGRIIMTLDSTHKLDHQIVAQIRAGEQVVSSTAVTTTDSSYTYTFANINPGKYRVYLIYDRNNNGKWDTGDYYKGIQPERTYIYPEEISLKADWDYEILIEVGTTID